MWPKASPAIFVNVTRRLVVFCFGRETDVGTRYLGYGVSPRDYPPMNPAPGDATKLSANYYLGRDTRRSMAPAQSLTMQKSIAASSESDSDQPPALNRNWWKA